MRSLYIKMTILASILCMTLPLLGQGAPPGTPIDGGLSALLVAGGIYGAKKLYDKRK